MPEQLSQSQIDALLKKMNSGDGEVKEEPVQKVKEYDFKSPKKFTKEQLKSLDSLHETFSRQLASYFSGILRTVNEVEVVQIEEQRYYEYSNAIPDTALVGLVEMKPASKRYDDSTIVLDLSTNVGYYLIDRVLGGPGTGFNLDRNYTEIELKILTSVFQRIVQHVEDTWNNNLDIKARLSSIETNGRLLQVFAPEDIVVIIMISIKLGGKLEGSLSICIPAEFLEQIIDTFSIRYAHSNKKQDPAQKQARKRHILESVCESDMEIKAIFDPIQLQLQDIMQLQVDDIIPLNKPIESDVTITVGEIPWYTAKMGETKLKKAIKLQNIINRDEGVQWQKSESSN